MKTIYEFTIDKEQEVEEKQETADGVLTKKVKKELPVYFALRKPTRSELEEGDLVYAIEVNKFIKMGLMTRQMLLKKYREEGGLYTDSEFGNYAETLIKMRELRTEFYEINTVQEDKRTPEQKKRLDELTVQIIDLNARLERYEALQEDIFENTAEVKAKNACILWWLVTMSYFKNQSEEDYKPFFGEGNSIDKKESYNKILDSEDEFIQAALQRLTIYVSLWYMQKASNEDDFKRFDEENKAFIEEPAEQVSKQEAQESTETKAEEKEEELEK